LTRKKKNEEGVKTGWLMTFADMITLLLCFFVLLNIMSTIDVAKFKQLVENLRGDPSIFDYIDRSQSHRQTGLTRAPETNDEMWSEPSDIWTQTAARMIETVEEWENGLFNEQGPMGSEPLITITVTEGYIIIRCQNDEGVLFNSGRFDLLPRGREILDFIVEELVLPHWDLISEIRIEGYADERPFEGPYGNLRLSVNRAVSAYIHVVEKYGEISTEDVSPSGYGATRPLSWEIDRETGERETRERWLQRNRRVEFVLLRNFLVDEENETAYVRPPSDNS
jgi:chemotaxis protein MotB